MTTIIETPRLILRTWQATDAAAYFRINQDPKVLEFLGGPLTMQQVTDFMTATNKHQEKLGFTQWAAEIKTTGTLIGYIGLNNTDFFAPYGAPFSPAIEVAWRLDSNAWGKGYATEGAFASLDYGFNTIGLNEIVSFTVPANKRSIRVMERIGLIRDLQGDFAHPKLPSDHPLSHHILYRLRRDDYLRLHDKHSKSGSSPRLRGEVRRGE